MTVQHAHNPEPQSATERLLEASWEARRRRASRRELAVEAVGASLFIGVAVAFLLLSGQAAAIPPSTAPLLVAVYAAVARIEFPVGAGGVTPTQLVLVPMLVLLPPAALPAAVGLGLVLSSAIDFILGRVTARRVLGAVGDSWHALGPALVLYAAGSAAIGVDQLPLLAAALAASCVADLVSSVARVRLTGTVLDLRAQVRVMGMVWVIDATLAPLGFLAANLAQRYEWAVLFVLPLVFLLWLLARDRNRRIEQAYHRLQLVQQERERLQSAVRRLGDAFASKLELEGLLEILLHGSLEAVAAAAGRIRIHDGASEAEREIEAGDPALLGVLAGRARDAAAAHPGRPLPDRPLQVGADGNWMLQLPMELDAAAGARAAVEFVRPGRAFEADEITLIAELIAKAEISAGEILAHHRIRTQALTDSLTGLGNRRKLDADLATVLRGATTEQPSVLLLFDLDGFKAYNDTFGHLAGDALLARLGTKLQAAVAGHGTAYRLGGDEFCAHLALADAESTELIAEVAAALNESGREFDVRASLGVVLLPHEADSSDHALQLADERMYADKRSQVNGARNQAREVLLRTMRVKQPELDSHSSNVAQLASLVARRLGLAGESIDEIARAAELHDVGKVGIPDAVLNKPGPLSPEEWDFMHQHTILGERILHGAAALRPVARLVRASHEWWDGSGYPDGLAGEQIPLGARVVAVCDAYEAMTADRPYRSAMSHEAACEELRGGAGTQFDPAVVETFLSVVESEWESVEVDSAHDAAEHVRTLLAAASPAA